MNMPIPWPGNKDNAFVSGAYGPAQAYLEWTKFTDAESLWADAFKKSADIIISQIETGKVPENADMYFFPVAYMYRHGIELYLKKLVQIGIQLQFLQEEEVSKILGQHKLIPLWNKTRFILEQAWPDGDKNDLRNVERLIHKFHTLDSSGQNLRYPTDKFGNANLHLPSHADLSALKKSCDGLFSFFDGCDAGLSEMTTWQDTM
jgi:hypothetical protein